MTKQLTFEIIDLEAHFRLLAMDLYGEIPYTIKVADYVEEKYGDKSLIFKAKLMEAFENLFIGIKK